MAYAYEVRVISWDRHRGAWQTLEPAGRIAATGLRDAKRQALAQYGAAMAYGTPCKPPTPSLPGRTGLRLKSNGK